MEELKPPQSEQKTVKCSNCGLENGIYEEHTARAGKRIDIEASLQEGKIITLNDFDYAVPTEIRYICFYCGKDYGSKEDLLEWIYNQQELSFNEEY